MKTKAFVLLILVTCVCLHVVAQEEIEPAKPHRYFNSFQSGGLFGEKDKGTSFTFSTVHGVQLNKWRLGGGVGFDSYQRWRVVPVSAMVSFDIAKFKNSNLSVSVNGGYSQAWYRHMQEYEPDLDVSGGVMINPLIGYRIIADKWNINLSAGYRWQRINYTYSPQYWYWSDTRQSPVYSVTEDIERVVVQIGFGLN
jgi:hypothetical protein